MKSTMLVAALAGVSVLAAGQSNGNQKKAQNSGAKAATPAQTSASGASQNAESHGNHHVLPTRESSQPSVSEIEVKRSSAKPMAQDDWHQTSAKQQQPSTHVAAGDLNGDGTPDVAKGTTNQRDLGSGEPSDKRQHKPVQVNKHADSASPKL